MTLLLLDSPISTRIIIINRSTFFLNQDQKKIPSPHGSIYKQETPFHFQDRHALEMPESRSYSIPCELAAGITDEICDFFGINDERSAFCIFICVTKRIAADALLQGLPVMKELYRDENSRLCLHMCEHKVSSCLDPTGKAVTLRCEIGKHLFLGVNNWKRGEAPTYTWERVLGSIILEEGVREEVEKVFSVSEKEKQNGGDDLGHNTKIALNAARVALKEWSKVKEWSEKPITLHETMKATY